MAVDPFTELVHPSVRTGTWTAWQMARHLHRPSVSAAALARLALRSKSTLVLDALAMKAVAGGTSAAGLQQLDLESPGLVLRDPRAAAALALAWAGMARDTASMAAAAGLYRRVIDEVGAAGLSQEQQQAAAQSMFLSGRFEQVRAVLPELDQLPDAVRSYLEADLESPAVVGGRETRTWLQLLSRVHLSYGIEPLSLIDADDDTLVIFDRLDSIAPAGTVTGPLISVVTPCFRPDEGLLTSVRSIARQTWTDLEIVLVDDGSGPEFDLWFERALAMDDRVRVVRSDANGGAYAARNRGIAESRGSILTFQDADDWSHPRRLELQVAPLLAREATATRSAAVRARPDLTHQWFGYSPVRPNASSLMIRREDHDRLGPFLEIRKGADSEYLERIEVRGSVLSDLDAPLAVTRLREGSLSRGDFTYQWAAPDRLDFRGGYRAWHRGSGSSTSASRKPEFIIPTTFRTADHALRQLDLIWTADYSRDARHRDIDLLTPWMVEAARTGMRQGLWHLESPVKPRAARPEMSRPWRDRIERTAGMFPVCRTDAVSTALQVVVDPSVLLICGEQSTTVVADEVEIWLTPSSFEPDRTGLPVDLLWVADQCRRWWPVQPRWVVGPHLSGEERDQVHTLAGNLMVGVSGVSRLSVVAPADRAEESGTERAVAAMVAGGAAS